MLLKRRKRKNHIDLTDECIDDVRGRKHCTLNTITAICNDKLNTIDKITEADISAAKEQKHHMEKLVHAYCHKDTPNEISFTDEEFHTQCEIAAELRAKAKEVGYNHKAKVTYMDGTVETYDYYWVEGKDGKLFLFAGLKDLPDLKITLDLHKDVKSVQLG